MLKDGTPFKFHLYGTGKFQYGQDIIMPLIRELKPDFFGVLLDSFMMHGFFHTLDFAPAISYFYFPSDGGGGLPDGCEYILRKVNIPIAMSRFAQQQVKEVYGIECEYIPHGVDTKRYYKLNEEEKSNIKRKWGLEGKFVVGIVARNQPRKMLDQTIRVAKEICTKYQDVMFFMHCDPFDNAAAFNLVNLITRYQLQNRFIFSGMKVFNSFSYEQMNEIYNLFDVMLSTTSGEGFGLAAIEAMSCQVPVVITNYTTSKELIEENGIAGELVNLATEVTGSWMVDRAVIDIKDCVEKLETLYLNSSLRMKYGEVGRKKCEQYYSWDVVIPMWNILFRKYKNG